MNRLAAHLWPFAEYRDADRGNLLERSAAYRHNRELARRLPVYVNRWALICAVLLILTQVVPKHVGTILDLLFTISFCAVMHLGHLWLLFRRLS